MAYEVLARKWRPQVFEEVVGQDAITKTLKNALQYDRLHHAYVFSGARGVGKTTTARLLAKALNCHKTEGPNPVPCGNEEPCVSCLEVAEGRSMDVLEFDAASHTGVDDIRDVILESINVSAARDQFKVFIIDEVHMLSKSSFNALLKTLEEPPENVVFVMATTEFHKVPITITSRCQEFKFRTIPVNLILERLKLIADTEKIEVDEKVLREIARSGEGSMRDAQSNFDQVISFSQGKIDANSVAQALGLASSETVIRLIRVLTKKDHRQVLEIVEELSSEGHDLSHFCNSVMVCVRDLLVFKLSGEVGGLLDASGIEAGGLKELSDSSGKQDLIRWFNSLSDTFVRMREANDPRYPLEIGLLKIVEMSEVTPIEELLASVSAEADGVEKKADGAVATGGASKKKL